MPLPTSRDVHAVDQPLSNVSQSIMQSADNFIAGKVFPIVQVPKRSDRYYIFDQPDFYRTDATKRESGAESAGVGYRLSTDTYYADVWAVHQDLGRQELANADAGLDLRMAAVNRVTNDLLLRLDVDWVSNFFTTSVWNADTTPSLTWDDAASTPIEDVRARVVVMAQNTGVRPNTMVIGVNVWKRLVDHPDIIERIKYTGGAPAMVTEQALAALFGVDRLYVAWATRNTAVEGAASGTYGFIAGNHALLLYVPSAPGLMVPASGYTFVWSEYGGGLGPVIRRFPIIERAVPERIEAEIAFDYKKVAAPLGEFFSSVVAS